MVEHTLGKKGKIACWLLYLFLFYSVLVAYIAGIGGLVSTILKQYFEISFPNWGGSLFFVILFGIVVFLGTRQVDMWNRVLMVGKLPSLSGLSFLV
jgi:tyrosine-specific transport protein